jgi:hypothetical protein
MTRPDSFEVLGIEIDVAAATVTGRWAIEGEVFTETAVVPGGDLSLPGIEAAAELWCLLAGVSYFKTSAPRSIDLGPVRTTAADREFLRRFYVAGLGEFALGNGLDLSDLTVGGPEGAGPADRALGDPGRVLIPFGGGLDSIVTVAELADLADDAALFVVERPGSRFDAIEVPAAATGLDVVRVERLLDPKVLESASRGYLNGHVPVTGVISALAVLAAVATGRGAVAMSNERSASAATTEGPHGPVNHQWSKGLEFEVGFRSLVEGRVGTVAYFSWLRDRSELSIAAVLAGLEEYLPLFRSCNRSFHQDPARRLDRWCGTCDKCLFINLALAPFLAPEALADIFDGTEPLVQGALAGQLRVLVGMSEEARPFECVGDEEECREALLRAAERPDRAHDAVLQELAREVALVHRPTDPPPPAAVIPERYAPSAGLG